MNKIERIGETFENLYVKKEGDKKIEELCSSLKSLEFLKDKDTAIVVLTGGLSKVEFNSGEDLIKTEFVAHMRESAAALKYKEFLALGRKPIIIVSGGKVYGKGEETPILSEVMKAELIRKYKINPKDIIAEPCSVDTSQNARFSSKILDVLGFSESDEKSTFLITSQFHLDRAKILFDRYFKGDIKGNGAEQILIDFVRKFPPKKAINPYREVVERYLNSQLNKNFAINNKKLKEITKLPFGEKFIEALAYYLRSSEQEKEIPVINKKRSKI